MSEKLSMNKPMLELRERLQIEKLEAAAEAAEMSKAYHVDGISADRGKRAEVLARIARLDVELFKMNCILRKEKDEASDFNKRTILASLCRKLEAAGQGALIEEARKEAFVAMEEAGFLEAYRR